MEIEFDYDFSKLEAEEKMENALNIYEVNISKIQTGRANPQLISSINVNYFGSPTPINQIANISVPEPRQLLIKPYDMSIVKEVTGVLNASNLGVQAVNEGDKVRMTFPELTTDRRRELVKSLSKYTEQARVQVRSARQEINKKVKSSKQAEDIEKRMLEDVQKLTDKFISKIDSMTKEKERSLMQL